MDRPYELPDEAQDFNLIFAGLPIDTYISNNLYNLPSCWRLMITSHHLIISVISTGGTSKFKIFAVRWTRFHALLPPGGSFRIKPTLLFPFIKRSYQMERLVGLKIYYILWCASWFSSISFPGFGQNSIKMELTCHRNYL